MIEIENFTKRLHEALDESEEKENDESDLSVEQQASTASAATLVGISDSKKRTLGRDELPLSSSHSAELNTDHGCLFSQAATVSSTSEGDKYTLEVGKQHSFRIHRELECNLKIMQVYKAQFF